MKRHNNKFIYVFLFIETIIACILPIIFIKHAAISFNSAPALIFGICSVIYAIIAILNKEHGNAFLLGKNKLFITFLRSLRNEKFDTHSDEYKKEFTISAFIFCASIPIYIPIAFLTKNFYATISLSLSVAFLRILITFALVLIPRIIKNLQDQKQERIKDEADRKEQERRESMGKWK